MLCSSYGLVGAQQLRGAPRMESPRQEATTVVAGERRRHVDAQHVLRGPQELRYRVLRLDCPSLHGSCIGPIVPDGTVDLQALELGTQLGLLRCLTDPSPQP